MVALQGEQVLVNILVKPEKPVFSYLPKLTGLTAEAVNQHGNYAHM